MILTDNFDSPSTKKLIEAFLATYTVHTKSYETNIIKNTTFKINEILLLLNVYSFSLYINFRSVIQPKGWKAYM